MREPKTQFLWEKNDIVLLSPSRGTWLVPKTWKSWVRWKMKHPTAHKGKWQRRTEFSLSRNWSWSEKGNGAGGVDQDDWILERKAGTLFCLSYPPRPGYLCGLPVTTCMPTQTAQYPRNSLRVRNQYGIHCDQPDGFTQPGVVQQWAPPSVYSSANGARAPWHVGKVG